MKTANTLIVASVIFGIIENCYFGWNMFPQSITEATCDIALFMMFLFGVSIKAILKHNA